MGYPLFSDILKQLNMVQFGGWCWQLNATLLYRRLWMLFIGVQSWIFNRWRDSSALGGWGDHTIGGVGGSGHTCVYIYMSIRWHTVFLDSKNCRGQSGHQGSTRGAKDGTVLFMRSSLLTENQTFYIETIALVMCHLRFLY